MEITAIEHAGRSAMAWMPEADDARTNYRNLMTALLPALAILSVAAVVLGRLLIA